MAGCRYVLGGSGTGSLSVDLVSSAEAATNWRTGIKEQANDGGERVTEHGQIRTLTRVADAPAVRQTPPPGDEGRCNLTVVLGVDAVVLVSVASDATDDLDALCSEASGVLETIVERPPEAD